MYLPAYHPTISLPNQTQHPSGTSPSDSGRFAKIRPNPDARRHPSFFLPRKPCLCFRSFYGAGRADLPKPCFSSPLLTRTFVDKMWINHTPYSSHGATPPPPPANPPLDKPPPTEYTPTLNPYRSPPGYLRRFLRNRHPSPRHPRAIATAYSAFLSLSESISRCLPQSGQKTSSMLPLQSVLPPVCRSRGVGSELTNGTATFTATWHAIQSVPS